MEGKCANLLLCLKCANLLSCWTMAFLPQRSSYFCFFPFEMLFTGFLSLHPVCCAHSTKALSAPAYLPSPQFPEISVDVFIWKWIIWMACQANRGGCTLVIFTGWSIIFLLVGIYKALPQIHRLKNLTPLPIPQIRHFFLLCSQRILWLGVSLCALVPWSRRRFQHVLWQTFTIKNLSVFSPQKLPGPFAGWQLAATWCFGWNVHSVWPCPSVNRIVKADSCVTSSCKQPLTLPLPQLLCTTELGSVAAEAGWSRSSCCRRKQLEKPLEKSQHGATCP